MTIKPVTEEDLNIDYSESGTKEKEEAEVIDDLEMCDDTKDKRQEGVRNSWKSRLRPRSPRMAAS